MPTEINRTKSILILFIFLYLGVLFNPFTIEYFIILDHSISSLKVKILLWGLSLILFSLGFFLFKFKKTFRNLNLFLLAVTSCMSVLFLSVIADRLVGKYILTSGIVYGPNYIVTYETPEFTYSAKINSQGFRGKEYPAKQKNIIRIITIGDSFTYGWGVNNNEVWSSIVEDNLNKKNYSVELINLGRSGAFPKDYVAIAKKAIPILHPDYVFICMLQGDDIMQESNFIHQDSKMHLRDYFTVSAVAKLLYPNLSNLLTKNEKELVVKENWKNSYKSAISQLDKNELKLFNQLPAQSKLMYKNGDINPDFFIKSIREPNYFITANDSSNIYIKEAMHEVAMDVFKIKRYATWYHAQVILVSMPLKAYINKKYHHDYNLIGLKTNNNLVDNNQTDLMLQKIANSIDIHFVSFTTNIKQASDTANIYFRFDAHFTKLGNQIFAGCVEQYITKNILNK